MSASPKIPVSSSDNLNTGGVSGRVVPSLALLNLVGRYVPEVEDVEVSMREQGSHSGDDGDNEY